MTSLGPRHRIDLPSATQAAARARWLESMSQSEQDAVHDRPMRLVEADFLLWCAEHALEAIRTH